MVDENISISKNNNNFITSTIDTNTCIDTCAINKKNIKKIKNIKNTKAKISQNNFVIPMYSECDNLQKYNYTITQLKQIAKHYKQRQSGNKNDLSERLYNYLKSSRYIVRIQAKYRGYLQRKYNNLHGPGFFNRSLCTNDTDFCTLDDLTDINYSQFFSFKDEDDFIYGFDIASLYQIVLKNGNNSTNPYNRKLLPKSIITNIRHIIRISKALNIPINAYIKNNNEILTSKQRMSQRINAVFQDMDALGNYTNTSWFTTLNHNSLIIYMRELYDIWSYRAQLSSETKLAICPPIGMPFRGIDMQNIRAMSFESLQRFTLSVIENLVRSGISTENKTLGAYYALAALTLVSNQAATSMPWLYQSVAHYA